MQGNSVKKIDLSAYHPDIVDRLVTYLYTMNYADDDSEDSSQASTVSAAIDIRMCTIAKNYDIEPLRQVAIKKFQALAEGWDVAFFDKFPQSTAKLVQLAYEGFDATAEIRATLVGRMLAMSIEAGCNYTEKFSAIMLQSPEFAIDVASASVERLLVKSVEERAGRGTEEAERPQPAHDQ